ncbi:putative membrane protein [Dioscorea alata]|uniref:Membrane protein n=1 Tax=Dioscorea alata TaxID=55571 RepID=A0ACB7V131_DIOAL|nr:putative membrane protein [Dioscorea alata]
MAVSSSSLFRLSLLLLLLAAIVTACITLPVEKILKEFLIWIKQNLGPWGPLVLAIAYIPLTILAVPASILTLGGGYLFGLPVGFVADSIGATIGATAAFLLGRTIGKPYVISKLKDYPKFQAVAIAIQRSGFKPITFALVYVGTTLKDIADVTHGWSEVSTSRWLFIILGFLISAILMVCVTKVAKRSLEKALAENPEVENILVSSARLPITSVPTSDINQPLIIKVDSSNSHEN